MSAGAATARVLAVSAAAEHAFSKATRPSIRLLAGLGVEGDAHHGRTVQHRSRVAADPSQHPCVQIERFRTGLLAAVLDRDASGAPLRKAGVMAVVRRAGTVAPGDPIRVERPAPPHRALAPV